MIYAILGIIAAIGSAFAYIYKLLNDNRSLKQTIESGKVQEKVKEWADQIAKVEEKVTEDEQDYGKAKDEFNANNEHIGAKPLDPGGQG